MTLSAASLVVLLAACGGGGSHPSVTDAQARQVDLGDTEKQVLDKLGVRGDEGSYTDANGNHFDDCWLYTSTGPKFDEVRICFEGGTVALTGWDFR